ncbi:DUF3558 family protein [Actinophytocola glycyrrhizae]|uniref:DUF3558 family protein n=1 Tax=Actinophytocola glycyrrhizae TaxID=2044873 RepID=A0ABV9SAQ3_9PSEU
MRGALVVLSAVAAVVLAGCGEAVDTAKQTFPRSTVPAGQVDTGTGTSTGKPKTNDPAFSTEELRKLDPCALLSEDILASLGTPANNRTRDFSECSNYMEDKDGKDLNITLYVGETINNATEADQNIGGLPAIESELDDGSACFVSAVTSTNPNFGLRVQVGGEGEDLCATGRTVLTGVVAMVRDDPPQREDKRGSVAGTDPCTLLDTDQIKTAVGANTEMSPYSLHWCNWDGDSVRISVWIRTGYDPKDDTVDPGSPVDIGSGITAYQTVTEGAASCRLEWRHRSTGEDGADEIIEVDFDNSKAPEGDNGCGGAVAIAKLVIPALPKP